MDDRWLESMIGKLLRTGVLLAAATVFLGAVVYLMRHSSDRVDYGRFVAAGDQVRSLAGVVHSAASLDSTGLIQFGLLLLIATPVARVVMAAAGFALEKDRLYTLVSLIVLGILVFSLMHAT